MSTNQQESGLDTTISHGLLQPQSNRELWSQIPQSHMDCYDLSLTGNSDHIYHSLTWICMTSVWQGILTTDTTVSQDYMVRTTDWNACAPRRVHMYCWKCTCTVKEAGKHHHDNTVKSEREAGHSWAMDTQCGGTCQLTLLPLLCCRLHPWNKQPRSVIIADAMEMEVRKTKKEQWQHCFSAAITKQISFDEIQY